MDLPSFVSLCVCVWVCVLQCKMQDDGVRRVVEEIRALNEDVEDAIECVYVTFF